MPKTNSLLEEASKPETLPSRLWEIYNSTKNYKIKLAVAANPNVDPKHIPDFIRNSHMVQLNPVIPLLQVEDPSLFNDFRSYTKIRKINSSVLDTLITHYLAADCYLTLFKTFEGLFSCDQILHILKQIKENSLTGNIYNILWHKSFYLSLLALDEKSIVKICTKYSDISLGSFLRYASQRPLTGLVRKILTIALKYAKFKYDVSHNNNTKRTIIETLLNDTSMTNRELAYFTSSAKYQFAWEFPKEEEK